MLQELFLALLGFPGDVLVETADTIRVKDGFDLLTLAEREQLNRVSPLGWFYLRLSAFVDEYETKWGGRCNGRAFQAYRTAMSLGVADLLSEYASEVAYLEQLVISEGPVPLSQILLHLQRFLLTMPAVYAICSEVEARGIRGCQILDYLTLYQSGVPVVTRVVQRLLLHVRAVFLKQLLAWMVFGELDDPGGEFFIQCKTALGGGGGGGGGGSGSSSSSTTGYDGQPSIQDKVRGRLGHAFLQSESYLDASSSRSGGGTGGEGLPFDWANSYVLRLELLPEAHISPRMASKVLFAGKAARLLQSAAGGMTDSAGAGVSDRPQGAYRYLSGGFGVGLGQASEGKDGRGDRAAAAAAAAASAAAKAPMSHLQPPHPGPSVPSVPSVESKSSGPPPPFDPLDAAEAIFSAHAASCGYEQADLDRYGMQFMSILDSPEHALETLERLVDQVNAAVSGKIWSVLRERFGFGTFLKAIRNTYLLGKGELYQLLLDGVSAQMHGPAPDTARANIVLNWGVVRQAAKLLGLDDDELCALFRLRVNAHVVAITPLALGAAAATTDDADAASSPSSATMYDLQESDCGALVAGSARMYRPGRPAPRGSISSSGSGPLTGPRAALVTPPGHDAARALSLQWTWQSLHRAGDLMASRVGGLPPVGPLVEPVTGEAFAGPGMAASCGARNRTWLAAPAGPLGAATSGAPLPSSAAGLEPSYAVGALWLADHKYLVKGFSLSTTFGCNLLALPAADLAAAAASAASSGRPPASSSVGAGMNLGASLSTISLASAAGDAAGRDGGMEGSLLLGCLTCTVHSDRLGGKTVPAAPWGMDIPASLCVGVSFHALAEAAGASGAAPRLVARVFIAANQASSRFRSAASVASVGPAGTTGDMVVLAERVVPIVKAGPGAGLTRALTTGGLYALEVEYSRELSSSSGSSMIAGTVQYLLSARVRDVGGDAASALSWDLSSLVDLSHYVKLQGGQGTIGLTGSGLVLAEGLEGSRPDATRFFGTDVYSLSLRCRGALSTYPVASPHTSARHPETFVRLEAELNKIRAWLGLRLSFKFPPVFGIVVDAEAQCGYDRLFSFIIKIRLVAHCLERLWKARSRLSSDRQFCMVRHSMHFFATNLLYYLQVDCVDSEFAELQREIDAASDLQVVLRAHRNFLAALLRVSLVDHLSVQEGVERVLQACLRFIAVCRLLQQQEGIDESDGAGLAGLGMGRGPGGSDADDAASLASSQPSRASSPGMSQIRARVQRLPVVVPPEELEAIKKEFFSQIAFLFSVARKIENRGFMFRLDFNGYLSSLMQEV